MKTYRVERYSAAGHNPTTLIYASNVSRKEALAIVRQHLHVSRLRKVRLWHPPEELGGGEGYHDCRPSHPNADGCGGYQIIPEDTATIVEWPSK